MLAFTLASNDSRLFAEKAAQALAVFKGQYTQTLTLDNGPEIKAYEYLEKLSGAKVYFAYPYHSWERGTNENTNGLLRYYFPKQMSLAQLSQAKLDEAVDLLNTRPRKRLGYKTPVQALKATGAFRTRI